MAQKILIVGASGLLGSNCMKHFSSHGWTLEGTYFSYPMEGLQYFNTLDLSDLKNFDIDAFNPDVIVHCGALTHVDKCETEQQASYDQTVQSTINLLGIAKRLQATFVYISTDYVFDGTSGPYTEAGTINPLSVYGQHKLEAEQHVQQSGLEHIIIRITNVYGDEARGKNFVSRIIDQCKANQTLTLKLPKDQYATPTNAYDIARALALLIKDGQQGIFHISSTDFMNRIELALKVLSYFPEAKYHLEALDTATLQQPAARPLLGGLISQRFKDLYPEFLFTSVDNYLQKKIVD
jgi:dTDP-4-dehydrorhamnose reductase